MSKLVCPTFFQQLSKNTKDIEDLQKTTTDISQIETDISNINNDLTNINNDLTNINNDLTNINNDLTNINNDLTNINNEITGINNELSSINTDITTLDNEVTSKADKTIVIDYQGTIPSVATVVSDDFKTKFLDFLSSYLQEKNTFIICQTSTYHNIVMTCSQYAGTIIFKGLYDIYGSVNPEGTIGSATTITTTLVYANDSLTIQNVYQTLPSYLLFKTINGNTITGTGNINIESQSITVTENADNTVDLTIG